MPEKLPLEYELIFGEQYDFYFTLQGKYKLVQIINAVNGLKANPQIDVVKYSIDEKTNILMTRIMVSEVPSKIALIDVPISAAVSFVGFLVGVIAGLMIDFLRRYFVAATFEKAEHVTSSVTGSLTAILTIGALAFAFGLMKGRK